MDAVFSNEKSIGRSSQGRRTSHRNDGPEKKFQGDSPCIACRNSETTIAMTPSVPTKIQMVINNALLSVCAGLLAMVCWGGNIYLGHINEKLKQIDADERAIGILSSRADSMHEAIVQLVQTDRDLLDEIKTIRSDIGSRKP
jgi:hypothetical protein